MSTEIAIACRECRVQLWVGSIGMSGERLLWGNTALMARLADMLCEHQGHTLCCDATEHFEDEAGAWPPFQPDPAWGHPVHAVEAGHAAYLKEVVEERPRV